MNVYIPIANSQPHFQEVLDSLTDHPMVDNVFIHSTKDYAPKGDKIRHRYIADNLIGIFKIAQALNEDYFLITNSDIVHNGKEIPIMLKYMEEHNECGAIGYSPYYVSDGNDGHVGTELMLIRTEASKDIKFNFTDESCVCRPLNIELRAAGWKVKKIGGRENGKVNNIQPTNYLR